MHTWFECKIRYEKTMDNGMNKKVTEPYLVDALSFTEAEARIIEEIHPLFPVSLQFPTLNVPTIASSFPVRKTVPTAGSSASCISLPQMKKVEQKKRRLPTYWYKQPTCVMQ